MSQVDQGVPCDHPVRLYQLSRLYIAEHELKFDQIVVRVAMGLGKGQDCISNEISCSNPEVEKNVSPFSLCVVEVLRWASPLFKRYYHMSKAS